MSKSGSKLSNNPVIILILIAIVIGNSCAIVHLIDKVDTIKSQKYNIDNIDVKTKIKIPANFNYTYKAFKTYNHETDTQTVVKFLDVANAFSMDANDKLLDLSIGQILLESGAKQYYPSGHPKDGQLVKSPVGAIGFCQIMPRTALEYFNKFIDNRIQRKMIRLGATRFSFATNDNLSKDEKLDKTKRWLSNKTNNIILWGLIMRRNLNKNGSMVKTLVAYNTGHTGMKRYVSRGGNLNNHKYIKGIQTRLLSIY